MAMNNNKRLRSSSGFTAASQPKYAMEMEYSYSNPISTPNLNLYDAPLQISAQQNKSFAPMMQRDLSSQSNISFASTGSTMNSTFDYDMGGRYGTPLSPASSAGMVNSPQVSSYGTGMARTVSGSSFASPAQTFSDLSWGSSQATNSSQYGFGMQRQDSGQGGMASPLSFHNNMQSDYSFTATANCSGDFDLSRPALIDIDTLLSKPNTPWWNYYDFHVGKEGGIHTLKSQYLVNIDWPKTRESPVEYDNSSKNKTKNKQVFRCYSEDCKSNPFSRPFDLERHFNTAHAGKEPTVCDYPRCAHRSQGKSFTRPDHEREHYREYHSEDLIKKGEKQIMFWLKNSGRNISPTWWRCVKCLKRNKTSGWRCETCGTACETERMQARTSVGMKTESRQSSTDSTSTIINAKMSELSVRPTPTLRRENATLKPGKVSKDKVSRSSKAGATTSRRAKESKSASAIIQEEHAGSQLACDCIGGYVYDEGMKFKCYLCDTASMSEPINDLKRKSDEDADYDRWNTDNSMDLFTYKY